MTWFFLIKKLFAIIVLGGVPKTDNSKDTQAGRVVGGFEELVPGWASQHTPCVHLRHVLGLMSAWEHGN